jgi:phosphoglucosamine mutase
VISASHNPYEDNGIKFFAGDGFKLSDETEHEIERELDAAPAPRRERDRPRARAAHGALEDYLRELHTRFRELDLGPVGRAAGLRQRRHLPRRAGDLPALGARGDGDRRSSPTGATSTPAAARRTSRQLIAGRGGDHDVGFAFDGDGDRVLAVDRAGQVVDGDELMALARCTCASAGASPAAAWW